MYNYFVDFKEEVISLSDNRSLEDDSPTKDAFSPVNQIPTPNLDSKRGPPDTIRSKEEKGSKIDVKSIGSLPSQRNLSKLDPKELITPKKGMLDSSRSRASSKKSMPRDYKFKGGEEGELLQMASQSPRSGRSSRRVLSEGHDLTSRKSSEHDSKADFVMTNEEGEEVPVDLEEDDLIIVKPEISVREKLRLDSENDYRGRLRPSTQLNLEINFDAIDDELKLIETMKPKKRSVKKRRVRRNYETNELYQETESGETDKLELSIIDSTGEEVNMNYRSKKMKVAFMGEYSDQDSEQQGSKKKKGRSYSKKKEKEGEEIKQDQGAGEAPPKVDDYSAPVGSVEGLSGAALSGAGGASLAGLSGTALSGKKQDAEPSARDLLHSALSSKKDSSVIKSQQ
mmetsp:Transcript_25292/g.39098  ORF Transcript_25292/g.39098 Transcript_25292/m.39098 type:complete len:397 (+) Transcript_25292:5933-7123(+)